MTTARLLFDALRGAPSMDLPPIGWAINGGEIDQGQHKARPSHPDWYRAIRDACAVAGVTYLHKQNGEWRAVCEGDGDWYAPLYQPKVAARDGEDEEALDDIYGRRCTVPHAVMTTAGTVFDDIAAPGAYQQGTGSMLMFRVGKRAAGRLLDGVEHNGMPPLPSPSDRA